MNRFDRMQRLWILAASIEDLDSIAGLVCDSQEW